MTNSSYFVANLLPTVTPFERSQKPSNALVIRLQIHQTSPNSPIAFVALTWGRKCLTFPNWLLRLTSVYEILAQRYCPGEGTLTLTVSTSPSGTEMIKTHHGCDWQTPHRFWKMTCLQVTRKSNSSNFNSEYNTDPLCQHPPLPPALLLSPPKRKKKKQKNPQPCWVLNYNKKW